MLPMTQEFVSQLNDSEGKLNDEIDDLLNGVDFQKSMSQENSPNCIPSTFPEENEFKSMEQNFVQTISQGNSPNCIPSTFPEENGFNSIQENDVNRNEEVSSPLLFTQQEKEEEEENQEVQMGNTLPFNGLDMNVLEDSGV